MNNTGIVSCFFCIFDAAPGNGDNGLTNGFHGTQSNGRSPNASIKNGFGDHHSHTSSDTSNVFASDGDFVADFSTANIFNAMNGKPTAAAHPTNGKHTNYVNGNHTNGFDKLVNGNGNIDSNGFSASNGGAGENFADFEHNTIYNAAGKETASFRGVIDYFPSRMAELDRASRCLGRNLLGMFQD